jgi:hypothetical protein
MAKETPLDDPRQKADQEAQTRSSDGRAAQEDQAAGDRVPHKRVAFLSGTSTARTSSPEEVKAARVGGLVIP